MYSAVGVLRFSLARAALPVFTGVLALVIFTIGSASTTCLAIVDSDLLAVDTCFDEEVARLAR
jgi:hypothetical protein